MHIAGVGSQVMVINVVSAILADIVAVRTVVAAVEFFSDFVVSITFWNGTVVRGGWHR